MKIDFQNRDGYLIIRQRTLENRIYNNEIIFGKKSDVAILRSAQRSHFIYDRFEWEIIHTCHYNIFCLFLF